MSDPHQSAPGPTKPQPLAELLRSAAVELAAQPVPPLPAELLQPERRAAATPAPTAAGRPAGNGWFGWTARPAARLSWWAGVAAGVALLAGAAWIVLGPALPPRPDAAALAAAAADGRFVPVVSTERWQRLAGEGASPAWLMQAELPREQLAAYGLPYDPSRAAEPVRAELLLNPAGEVLALRVVKRPAAHLPAAYPASPRP